DHDQDGKIGENQDDVTLNKQGIKETGTFLKTIALLPYLKKLGVNTIHLLPITEIGIEGRKGDMGSPYAIKNPFKIDPNLADPLVQIPVEDQYKALIEAAHHLGIRVVQEFIFRTAAIDSDWSGEHPNWFYWIKDDKKYGPPKFTTQELEQILKVPKGRGKYIPPGKSFRDLFDIPPTHVDKKSLKIASAFADWPPNDLQPPWSDVTYLRLYNYDYRQENNYNYIAYNTIRYYDPELAKKEHINHELWNKIADIIPYYQKTFGIDGAMIDMGHALPNRLKSKIIKNARDIDPAFAFWDENFDNKNETKKDGYNAVIGDAWYKITKRNGFRKIITSALEKKPLPFFGAPETHNSPRYGYRNAEKKKSAWILFNILPNAIPFIHNGFELNEKLPVNTGLNFNKKEIEIFSKQPLALFWKNSLNWDTSFNIVSFVLKIEEIKSKYPWIFNGNSLSILKTDNKKVLGFSIKNKHEIALILFNTNFYKKERFCADVGLGLPLFDLFNEKGIDLANSFELGPGKTLLAISK
ncbi:MAG: hypothetical protein KAI29_31840, partial [Cyclobacteriaceae bacterium]|nr:hypothetical protein [Cyclobacteriaceae bacterium]